MSRSLQGNAADPRQVRYAERKVRERDARFLDALQVILRTPAGRIVCWDLLTRAGIFRSIWENSARIHYNAGRQDFGHELLASLVEADEGLYQVMEKEARVYQRGEDRETEAAQTPSSTERETSNG